MHHVFEMPPFLGMMTGLGVLKSYGYLLRRKELATWTETSALDGENAVSRRKLFKPAVKPFDVFISMKRVEWDTLMFFYGIMLCVGGLGALGYLATLSQISLWRFGSHNCEYPCRGSFSGHRQHSRYVCGIEHEPGYERRPMAVGDIDRRCRWVAVVYRVGSGRGPHGAGGGSIPSRPT